MKRGARLNLELLEGRALLSGFSAGLTTNTTVYQPGQPVVMTFQETNVSDRAIAVQDGPSIDGFTVSEGDQLIWRSNAGINPMFIRLVPLQPGQSFTLSATWDGETSSGSAASPGTFVIQNELDPGVSATVTISSQTTTTSTGATPQASAPQPIGVVTSPDPLPAPSGGSTSTTAPQPIGVATSPDPTSGSAADPTGSPIAVSVSTDHPTYHKGHRVRIALTLRNVSDAAVTLPIDATDQFSVSRGSKTVWRDARVVSGVGTRTIQPGQSLTVRAVWHGKAHQAGVPMAAGIYTVQASADGYTRSMSFAVTA